MIIDAHAHSSPPSKLWVYKSLLLSHRGYHGRGGVQVSEKELRQAMEDDSFEPGGNSHMQYIDRLGTDMQLMSPRPFQLMQSEKPAKLVQWFTEECNNMIAEQVKLWPDRFIGICGLPQFAGEPPTAAIAELERCVKMGFKGCLLNPDPYEATNADPPAMGDRYWYPLYEKLCELDVPAHIHGTGSRAAREPYSLRFINEETTAIFGLLNSDVLKDFPTLKIVVSHGGGAMPFQLGRFEAGTIRAKKTGKGELFSDKMRKLWFDTVLYTDEAVEFLIKVVGHDRCLFGAECPGVGSQVHPRTNKELDDVAPSVQKIEWLTDEQKYDVLAGNAIKLFKLDVKSDKKPVSTRGLNSGAKKK